jgi:hypothetical protein
MPLQPCRIAEYKATFPRLRRCCSLTSHWQAYPLESAVEYRSPGTCRSEMQQAGSRLFAVGSKWSGEGGPTQQLKAWNERWRLTLLVRLKRRLRFGTPRKQVGQDAIPRTVETDGRTAGAERDPSCARVGYFRIICIYATKSWRAWLQDSSWS